MTESIERNNAHRTRHTPTALVEVVFLSPEEGGRTTVPNVSGVPTPSWAHIVIQDRTVRRARMTGNTIDEEYYSVLFVDGPSHFGFGLDRYGHVAMVDARRLGIQTSRVTAGHYGGDRLH